MIPEPRQGFDGPYEDVLITPEGMPDEAVERYLLWLDEQQGTALTIAEWWAHESPAL